MLLHTLPNRWSIWKRLSVVQRLPRLHNWPPLTFEQILSWTFSWRIPLGKILSFENTPSPFNRRHLCLQYPQQAPLNLLNPNRWSRRTHRTSTPSIESHCRMPRPTKRWNAPTSRNANWTIKISPRGIERWKARFDRPALSTDDQDILQWFVPDVWKRKRGNRLIPSVFDPLPVRRKRSTNDGSSEKHLFEISRIYLTWSRMKNERFNRVLALSMDVFVVSLFLLLVTLSMSLGQSNLRVVSNVSLYHEEYATVKLDCLLEQHLVVAWRVNLHHETIYR